MVVESDNMIKSVNLLVEAMRLIAYTFRGKGPQADNTLNIIYITIYFVVNARLKIPQFFDW